MAKMFILRGLPGCGKSYKAREIQKEHGGRICERDEIRMMLFGKYTDVDENVVTEVQQTLIDQGLHFGENVIVSDMNLRNQYVKALIEKAWKFNVDYEIVDLTDVPLEQCILQNNSFDRKQRGKNVPDHVIRDLHQRFVNGKPHPLPVQFTGAIRENERKFELYVPDTRLPDAIIVDIDGTLARMTNRGPFDEHLVKDDELIEPVARMVEHAMLNDVNIIFMSGRTDACYEDTQAWLIEKIPMLGESFGDVPDFDWDLIMRRSVEDRGRPDDIVKYELFRRHVAHRYNVLYVIDDRNKVVKMWREIGLVVAQVAEGEF